MDPEESKISVWVCREEKLVSGLSKRTTCADVIKVLLEEQSSGASPRAYCIVEKWRGSERVLPHKTKILRLWSAWGEEQENVRFVLVRSEASLAGGAPRSAEARVVLSRESPRVCRANARAFAASTAGSSSAPTAPTPTDADADVAATALSRERQRRIVRKAFRKLERMNRRHARAVAKDALSAERMETLVHVVVSQDHTIRQQIRRLEELDAEIDRHEARVHLDRVRAHGANYVQDTYLVGAEQDGGREDRDGSGSARPNGVALALRLEEYADTCEEVVRLHEELAEREALAASLTSQIEQELNRRWMERRRDQPPDRQPPDRQPPDHQPPDLQPPDHQPPDLQPPEHQPPDHQPSDLQPPDHQPPDHQPPEHQPPDPEDPLLEEERVRTELDTSLYIGLRLNTDLEALRSKLDLSQEIWDTREKELRDLLEKVDSLELEEDEDEDEDEEGKGEVRGEGEARVVMQDSDGMDLECPRMPASQSPSAWVEQVRALSKTCNSNDDDSDTGLSSMHSQDSDSAPVCESLV